MPAFDTVGGVPIPSVEVPNRAESGRRAAKWFFLTQAVSRLVSFYIFAVIAHRVDAGYLGALALATAFTTGAFAFAPAIVRNPLAAANGADQRRFAPSSQSAAILCSLVVGVGLVGPALVSHGLLRIAFASGAIGVPAVMIVESTYWRSVFEDGPKRAALAYVAAYGLQAVVVTVAVFVLSPGPLVFVASAALALPAAVLMLRKRNVRFAAARSWLLDYRARWLPYVLGVVAAVTLVQAIPSVLTATSGFATASAYRAGELAFGGTNLLMGVASQTLVTQRTDRPRRTYVQASALLALTAAVNGLVIWVLPHSVLHAFIGPTAPLLLAVVGFFTAQRAALAVNTVGAAMLVSRQSARVIGSLDVVAAVLSVTGLVAGAVVDSLRGALIGLVCAELLLAAICGRLLNRSMQLS